MKPLSVSCSGHTNDTRKILTRFILKGKIGKQRLRVSRGHGQRSYFRHCLEEQEVAGDARRLHSPATTFYIYSPSGFEVNWLFIYFMMFISYLHLLENEMRPSSLTWKLSSTKHWTTLSASSSSVLWMFFGCKVHSAVWWSSERKPMTEYCRINCD